jgi:hypothetical protein
MSAVASRGRLKSSARDASFLSPQAIAVTAGWSAPVIDEMARLRQRIAELEEHLQHMVMLNGELMRRLDLTDCSVEQLRSAYVRDEIELDRLLSHLLAQEAS